MGLKISYLTNTYKETDRIKYDDKAHCIFYNASSWEKVSDPGLKSLLKFIYNTSSESEYTQKLETESKAAKARPEWEDEYMYFMDILEDEKEKASELALQQGIALGKEEDRRLIASNLLNQGIEINIIASATWLTKEEILNLK